MHECVCVYIEVRRGESMRCERFLLSRRMNYVRLSCCCCRLTHLELCETELDNRSINNLYKLFLHLETSKYHFYRALRFKFFPQKKPRNAHLSELSRKMFSLRGIKTLRAHSTITSVLQCASPKNYLSLSNNFFCYPLLRHIQQ